MLHRPQYLNRINNRNDVTKFRQLHSLPTVLLKPQTFAYPNTTAAIPSRLESEFVLFLDELLGVNNLPVKQSSAATQSTPSLDAAHSEPFYPWTDVFRTLYTDPLHRITDRQSNHAKQFFKQHAVPRVLLSSSSRKGAKAVSVPESLKDTFLDHMRVVVGDGVSGIDSFSLVASTTKESCPPITTADAAGFSKFASAPPTPRVIRPALTPRNDNTFSRLAPNASAGTQNWQPWPTLLRQQFGEYQGTREILDRVHKFLSQHEIPRIMKPTSTKYTARCIPDDMMVPFFEFMKPALVVAKRKNEVGDEYLGSETRGGKKAKLSVPETGAWG
ncbi:hypothetical protein HDU98_010772, partial [Podochytrium sp. JEL0797]